MLTGSIRGHTLNILVWSGPSVWFLEWSECFLISKMQLDKLGFGFISLQMWSLGLSWISGIYPVEYSTRESFTAWKMSVFGVILVRIFPQTDWILRISLYSVRTRKNTYQNNSKYGHFLRSVSLWFVCFHLAESKKICVLYPSFR